MEPVYMDLDQYNIRLVQQNEEQIQQQFQSSGIIMSGSEKPPEDDQSQQHIVYSPMKQNEQQYVTQDEPIQGQYLVQSSPQQGQQVFYTNINPQNQNRIQQAQTIALNHNLISQQNQNQQKLVLQSPKVVVQRNSDLIPTSNITQIVDHQNQPTIQYHFAQSMDQNQTQQLIIQQPQIKQTIYPQQPNQVVSQPHYYQLPQIQQQNVVQQGVAKIVMPATGSSVRYQFIQKSPPQVQQIAQGQILQMNQQQQQIQAQGGVRQFRPRMISPVRVGLRVGSPQLQQQVITVQQQQQRPRTPKPRVVRPTAQNPLLHQQNSPQPRQQANKMVYILQPQPDGTQILVPHPQYQQSQAQPQPIMRMVQQKVVQTNQAHQAAYAQHQLNTLAQEQQQQQQQQNPPQADDAHTPATSTFTPKKEGDTDDLEDSITATAISKSTRSDPPPLQVPDEYRRRIMNQRTNVGVVRPMMNNAGSPIRSPTARSAALQVIRQRPSPQRQYQQRPGLTQELEVPERESAKMLVILDNGEQRLITFTLPKETCTVQELLDQVGIQVGADSNIECIENPGTEIDYIVKVGNFASRDTAAMTKAAENHIRQQQLRQQQINQNQRNVPQTPPQLTEVAKSKSPEMKGPPPKLINGFLAVCAACGASGIDHAKCVRCNRIFTEEPKRMPVPATKAITIPVVASGTQTQIHKVVLSSRASLDKKDQLEALQKKHQIQTARLVSSRGRGGVTAARPRVSRPRVKASAPEIVTLSSDDESGSDESKASSAKALALKKEEENKLAFEPEIAEDDVPADDFDRHDVEEFGCSEQKLSATFSCRSIRIGSYKYETKEKVVLTSKGMKILAPSLNKDEKEMVTLNIQHSEIVKIVCHYSKSLNIIFLYTKSSCAKYVCEKLQMPANSNDKNPYFSPLSRNEPERKIVFLPESINDETKSAIKSIFSRPTLEEINNRDANQMLLRSTGGNSSTAGSSSNAGAAQNNSNGEEAKQEIEIKKLLIYPPGRGGLSINTNDYICLGTDNYLNDVIIDFYLKYLHHEILTDAQREKTHIFSQFFYKRLTMVTKEKDPKLSAAQKRHVRVASWTKNVNIFEKDYVIIPINEQSHWFLAIICFPHLTEPHTMDGNQPIKLTPLKKGGKKKAALLTIGNTTITPLSKTKAETIHVGDDEGSERDEAEGDESDMEQGEEEDEVRDEGQPVKVPCILIFDSLLGAPRSRVVATLRDYLTCEYKAKFPNEPPRQYTRLNIFGNQVKVPQQNNFTDCGVFLLQYVEQFFKDPIKDFRLPIKSLINWFHHDVVTRKREEIAKLIEDLIKRTTPEGVELPKIEFPSKDGTIIEQSAEALLENAFDDDLPPTEEELKELNQNGSGSQIVQSRVYYSKKRSLDKKDSTVGESNSKAPRLKK